MRFLVIDNYDSFVYNIVQYLGELGVEPNIVRNDKIAYDAGEVATRYDGIVISPGPGTPEDKRYFGACGRIIKEAGPKTPILGVCLGHQGIIHAFGGKITNAGCVRHGKTSMVRYVDGGRSKLFDGVKNPFRATRYHSLVGDKTIIPDSLEITAVAEDDGEVMGVRHRNYLVEGVQFHPESVMTQDGKKILGNFVKEVRA